MRLEQFFKSVIDQDAAPVVLCDLDHTIVYMNPAAVKRYETRGGASLLGQSLENCHSPASREKIARILAWFSEDTTHNKAFETHNEAEDKDVYMVALRDADGTLAGYYEKHEVRRRETGIPYDLK